VIQSIKAAIKNIAVFGDTDIFPFSFEQHIFYDRPDLVQQALEKLDGDFQKNLTQNPPDNLNTLAPIGYTGFRWATQIDRLWNAYYLALVIEIAPAIEQARIPRSEKTVFSYRFITPTDDGKIFDDSTNWYAFLQENVEMAKRYPFVIVCDIADFYARIYHHRVENALKWLGTKADVAKRIVDLLKSFAGAVSYGLPVGGPASRLLAELALDGVDKLLRAHGFRFCRFVDDYRIFCTSKEQAYQLLIFFSEKLFNEGLTLQRNKTRIISAKEFEQEARLFIKSDQTNEADLSEEQKLLNLSIRFDPYSDTRVDDYELLKEQVSRVDVVGILTRELEKTRIDSFVTKQALTALRVVESEARNATLQSLLTLDNLATIAPVFTRLMIVLRGIYPELDLPTQEIVDDALTKLAQSGSHLIKLDLNLAYLIQVLRRRSTHAKEILLVKLFQENTSPLVRREIILAMTEWGHNYWVSDLKKKFNALSKWERRCFIVSSYFLGDEGKHWRNYMTPSFDLFELVVRDWFSERFQKNSSVPQ
jgi:Reverse transcriptase (RNA-dependent DNA polymerase)